MRARFLVVLALLLVPVALAATLHGTIYDADLKVAQNVVVAIDTLPQQRLLSTDGDYSFQVPPGNYTIMVEYAQPGVNATSTESVAVVQEGSFAFDLFLFPDFAEENDLLTLSDEDFTAGLDETDSVAPSPGPWPLIVLIVILLLLFIIPIFLLRRHFRKLDKEYGVHNVGDETSDSISDDKLAQVIDILKKEDGRMTQKELRARLPVSEAKVSLMITELEHQGKIKRIRKGRANVLVLQK